MRADRIQKYLTALKGWELKGEQKIEKVYKFPSFRCAIAFVNFVAELAEKQDHHPDITINYNKVTLELTTHSEKSLTEKDFILASLIDNVEFNG